MRPGVLGGYFDLVIVEERPGYLSFEIEGTPEAVRDFLGEGGGHRWQRIPPTERKGRVHTSTVTVAVIPQLCPTPSVDLRDVEFTTTKGDGPGGQHRNKTESAVIAHHVPTGMKVRIESDRSQFKNKATALRVLDERVKEASLATQATSRNDSRKQQVGTGARGDKVRTYRTQDDRVTDHRTGKTWQLSRWLRGEW